MQCRFCSKEFTSNRSISQHEVRCSSNQNRHGFNNKPRRPETWKCNQPKPKKPPSNQWIKARELGTEYIVREETRQKLQASSKRQRHSELTKSKLSVIRSNYLKEHPDKVPYLLNHSSRESYPEKYFNSIFEQTDLKYIKELQIGVYSLDFAFTESKIDLEIDGDQHYLDLKIVESDKRRALYLENLGWTIKRVKWSSYKKLTPLEQESFISELINGLK